MISTNSADVIFDGIVVASVIAAIATDGSYTVKIEIKDGPVYIKYQEDADLSIQQLIKNVQDSSKAHYDARLKG